MELFKRFRKRASYAIVLIPFSISEPKATGGDTQERTLKCGLNLSDIKSPLPGEDLNDKSIL